MSILLRFAPSPTGSLHLGGLRTALFNHLFARKHGGRWILRIEDTDLTRLVPSSVDNIKSSLEWAGLEYDFGPEKQGPHGPYFQSQRLDLYHKYSDKLLESGHAYRCFCSPDQLAEKRNRLQGAGSTATYDRACRKLSEEEVARRVRAKEKHVVRLDDSQGKPLPPFSDLIFGEVRDASASLPTDPILLKTDKFPTYHLASVVDDHEMGITHVLRGEEWLPSLPLHRDLYARLGLSEPSFGHLPLLLNPDGSKMSKRNSDVRVLDYAEKHWEPEAVLQWLSKAGRHQEESEPGSYTSIEQLTQQFDLTLYTKRRAILDPIKLKQFNRDLILSKINQKSTQELFLQRISQVLAREFPKEQYSPQYILDVVNILGDRISQIEEIPKLGRYFFDSSRILTPKPIPSAEYDNVINHFSMWVQEDFAPSRFLDTSQSISKTLSLPKKKVISSVRHALTGEVIGPSIADIMTVLGQKEVLRRSQLALKSG